MIKKPSMLLIDVDGTLVDSVPDLAYCVDNMMDRLGMPRRGEARVRNWVGNGVERLVQRALVDDLDGEPEKALYEKAYPVFLELYADKLVEKARDSFREVSGLAQSTVGRARSLVPWDTDPLVPGRARRCARVSTLWGGGPTAGPDLRGDRRRCPAPRGGRSDARAPPRHRHHT